MIAKLDRYTDRLNSLAAAAIGCMPTSWDRGSVSITCDGSKIQYAIKNDRDAEKARLSDDFRTRCEELYVAMRDSGDTWRAATLTLMRDANGAWGFKADFDYATEPLREAPASAPLERESKPGLLESLRSLLPAPQFTRSPEALVRQFLVDYKSWNDQAFKMDDADVGADDHITESWNKLLKKYCRPGFAGEPVAYGSRSMHDVAREAVVSTSLTGDRAVVTTRSRESDTFYSDYEYALSRAGGRWFLDQIYYVDHEGKYPSL